MLDAIIRLFAGITVGSACAFIVSCCGAPQWACAMTMLVVANTVYWGNLKD